MVKKFLKSKSKRVPARRRYKIEKKIRQHNKKLKKQNKKNPKRKKTKKEITVPNSLPFKDKILQEAEEKRRQIEEQKEKRKEEIKEKRKESREKILMAKRGLQSFQLEAEKRTQDFEIKMVKQVEKPETTQDRSLKTYYKEFQKVVEAADVILEVLDARDPLGTRCPQVEEAVISAGTNKHLVLVLNKIDLIPKDNLEQWLKYLRNEFPTVSFKASTQNQRKHLSQVKVPVLKSNPSLLQSSHCLGANILMKLLGNYCRNKDIKTAITVGIVGFPNVGKSSIINSLKRSRACNIGSTPGVTKSLQEVLIDKHIKLIDSPGIVLASKPDSAIMALHNAVKIENVPDPVKPVESILCRANKEQLMQYYKLPSFQNAQEFLALLANRLGRLKRKGIPDVDVAARKLVQDWNSGKIKYFTYPPQEQKLPAYISAEIVQELSRPFDLDSLINDEKAEYKGIPHPLSKQALLLSSSGPTEGKAPDLDNRISMEEEEEEEEEKDDAESMDTATDSYGVSISSKSSKKSNDDIPKKLRKKIQKLEKASKLEGNLKVNKAAKLLLKKKKKQLKRSDKLAVKLSDSLDAALTFATDSKSEDENDDYDFSTDFKKTVNT